jgi:hypothetical protein
MTILRCNKCGHLAKHPPEAAGSILPCPRCETPTQIHDAVLFIGKVLEKYFAMQAELKRLRAAATTATTIEQPSSPPTAAPETFDLHNSADLSTELQHGPIKEWMQRRHIQARTNLRAVDTTGLFDEVGAAIGKDYGVLREVVDRIRFAQLKGYGSTKIHLERKSDEDSRLILDFCRQLYDYAFITKFFHLRPEKVVRLVLQTAPPIQEFFQGEWLEWHTLMSMLHVVRQHKRRYSCARNLEITDPKGERFELDVFFLIDGERPICIECKSGEFRQDIERCLTLRKRLGTGAQDFIICAAGLDPDQARGLSSTYGLSFVSELDLPSHLERILSLKCPTTDAGPARSNGGGSRLGRLLSRPSRI